MATFSQGNKEARPGPSFLAKDLARLRTICRKSIDWLITEVHRFENRPGQGVCRPAGRLLGNRVPATLFYTLIALPPNPDPVHTLENDQENWYTLGKAGKNAAKDIYRRTNLQQAEWSRSADQPGTNRPGCMQGDWGSGTDLLPVDACGKAYGGLKIDQAQRLRELAGEKPAEASGGRFISSYQELTQAWDIFCSYIYVCFWTIT